ncbi:hypothetical protein IFM47457_01911 [Aspergillus lentulus]|nr:hypothetical protein IFM47457_01911 [Aspergillus lentulus]
MDIYGQATYIPERTIPHSSAVKVDKVSFKPAEKHHHHHDTSDSGGRKRRPSPMIIYFKGNKLNNMLANGCLPSDPQKRRIILDITLVSAGNEK